MDNDNRIIDNDQKQGPKERIDWCNGKEFDDPAGKLIVITSFAQLCGTQTNAKPEYRDKDGCTYRMTFKDMDQGGGERAYENCYGRFKQTLKDQAVEFNRPYRVRRAKDSNGYTSWTFTPEGGAEPAS